jgi:glyoxylase-like metal-dependent hydrolase (beta-lactamase superfamily II)
MQNECWKVEVLSDGIYLLDGGSMFGVVPRVLWEKKHPPDEKNRIILALNCLLLRSKERIVLVDNGMGDGWSEKDLAIYGLQRPNGGLVDDLARHGLKPEQITDVILTHLHFDHAGGTITHQGGEPKLTFPNAMHWLQDSNLRWAEQPTERDRASYLRPRWELLLAEEGRLKLVDGAQEIMPGIRTIPVSGHTPGQQLVVVNGENGQVLFAGDLIPYASQLRIPWIMAYDLNPLLTLSEKKDILARAAAEDWILVFEHDAEIPAARIESSDRGYAVRERVEF